MENKNRRILILGGSGFIGRELGEHLVAKGFSITVATRTPDKLRGLLPFPCKLLRWDGEELPPGALDDCEVVINLVGEGIADKAWSASRRAQIIRSRSQSVSALLRAAQDAEKKPRLLIQASAIGFYGDRGEDELTEESLAGSGFLAESTISWERELPRISSLDIRLVTLRLGVVLSTTGGALTRILSIYGKGLGAVLGSGSQWMSWIHIKDVVSMVSAAIADERWQGVYNATAPNPCRNQEFHEHLAKTGRYTVLAKVPKIALRTTMGQRSELVLSSSKVIPKNALSLGYEFTFKDIGSAIRDLVGDSLDTNLRRAVFKQWYPAKPEEIWTFFADAKNLEKLTPKWLSFRIENVSTHEVGLGTTIDYALRLRGVPVRWQSVIRNWQVNQSFVDEQVSGPYAFWHHTHKFEELGEGTLITDSIQYRLPLGRLSEIMAGEFVASDLQKIFSFRGQVIGRLRTEDLQG